MQMDTAPIWETNPKLAALPRWSWRSKKAWARLRRAKPFLLEGQGRVMYFVDSGGWARRLDDLGAPPAHASKLLDPAKKTLR